VKTETELAVEAFKGIEGIKVSEEGLPLNASEDVGEFIDLCGRGCFFMLGTHDKDKNEGKV